MKCALVTGSSRGIGKAIAVQLAKDLGLHILINFSSNVDAAKDTLKQIEENGGTGELLQFNVQDSAAVSSVIEKWQEENPENHVEVLVNNAGITRDNIFPMISEEDWDSVMNISVKGMYNCTQAVLRKMLRNRSGRIINVFSFRIERKSRTNELFCSQRSNDCFYKSSFTRNSEAKDYSECNCAWFYHL